MSEPTRPVLRWFGGKWRLAPWIISHFPKHRVYVEPFGGAGSVLMRKDRAYAEVWNDLDGEVVNLFQVLRSDDAGRLVGLLRLTPFAQDEFRGAYQDTLDPVERARRLVVRSLMGFGAGSACNKQSTGFRSCSTRRGTTPMQDWSTYPDALQLVIERLEGVCIASADASRVMRQHDGLETLHYVDPPYVHDTRTRPRTHGYAHELTDDQHRDLLATLRSVQGMVVLSGYANPLYDDALTDWQRVEREAHADGARKRTEALWLNPACSEALASEATPMFSEAAE